MTPLRVLHLVEWIGPNAQGRTVSRIVPALPRERVESLIVNLGYSLLPVGEVTTICHRLRYWLDLARYADIRRTFKEFRPNIVHAWGPLAVKKAKLFQSCRAIVSYANGCSDWGMKSVIQDADAVLVMSERERTAITKWESKPNGFTRYQWESTPLPMSIKMQFGKRSIFPNLQNSSSPPAYLTTMRI